MTTIKPATKGVITPCSDKYANIGIATILIEYRADLTFGDRFTNITVSLKLFPAVNYFSIIHLYTNSLSSAPLRAFLASPIELK